MKSNQKGFAAIEAVFIILYVLAIGFGGYLVWNNLQNKNKPISSDSAVVSYTDSAKTFSLKYPQNWKLQYQDQSGTDGAKPIPDYSKVTKPFVLLPPHRPTNLVSVQVGSRYAIAEDINKSDKFHTIERLTINGQDAAYDKLVFTGPSAAEKYTDHKYIIVSGNKSVILTFRESYYHSYPYENWNDAQDLAGFESIVNSVKILQQPTPASFTYYDCWDINGTDSEDTNNCTYNGVTYKLPTSFTTDMIRGYEKVPDSARSLVLKIAEDTFNSCTNPTLPSEINIYSSVEQKYIYVGVGCDSGHREILYAASPGQWQRINLGQMGLSCDIAEKYHIPKEVLTEAGDQEEAVCYNTDGSTSQLGG